MCVILLITGRIPLHATEISSVQFKSYFSSPSALNLIMFKDWYGMCLDDARKTLESAGVYI